MQLGFYLTALRKHLVVILAVIAVCVGVGALVTIFTPPKYSATSQVFVSVSTASSASELSQGASFAQQAVKSYARVAVSAVVLQPVLSQLDLPYTVDQLAQDITTSVRNDEVLIDVTALASSPNKAARISNAVSTQLTKVAQQLAPSEGGAAPSVKMSVIQPAYAPVMPSSPRPLFNLAWAVLLGIALSACVAGILEALDNKVRTTSDVDSSEMPNLLGTTPWNRELKGQLTTLQTFSQGMAAEPYRFLRANLRFARVEPKNNLLVVTSSISSEGKSVTTCMLGLSLAEGTQRVLIVDADLRRPRVAEYFGLDGGLGLTDVLIGSTSAADAIQAAPGSAVSVLPAGSPAPNPADLIQSERMGRLLASLSSEYDLVLVDSPPVLAVSDAPVLAAISGGVIVVAASNRVKRVQLKETVKQLRASGANISGLVLTMTRSKSVAGYYGYGYGAPSSGVRSATANEVPPRTT